MPLNYYDDSSARAGLLLPSQWSITTPLPSSYPSQPSTLPPITSSEAAALRLPVASVPRQTRREEENRNMRLLDDLFPQKIKSVAAGSSGTNEAAAIPPGKSKKRSPSSTMITSLNTTHPSRELRLGSPNLSSSSSSSPASNSSGSSENGTRLPSPASGNKPPTREGGTQPTSNQASNNVAHVPRSPTSMRPASYLRSHSPSHRKVPSRTMPVHQEQVLYYPQNSFISYRPTSLPPQVLSDVGASAYASSITRSSENSLASSTCSCGCTDHLIDFSFSSTASSMTSTSPKSRSHSKEFHWFHAEPSNLSDIHSVVRHNAFRFLTSSACLLLSQQSKQALLLHDPVAHKWLQSLCECGVLTQHYLTILNAAMKPTSPPLSPTQAQQQQQPEQQTYSSSSQAQPYSFQSLLHAQRNLCVNYFLRIRHALLVFLSAPSYLIDMPSSRSGLITRWSLADVDRLFIESELYENCWSTLMRANEKAAKDNFPTIIDRGRDSGTVEKVIQLLRQWKLNDEEQQKQAAALANASAGSQEERYQIQPYSTRTNSVASTDRYGANSSMGSSQQGPPGLARAQSMLTASAPLRRSLITHSLQRSTSLISPRVHPIARASITNGATAAGRELLIDYIRALPSGYFTNFHPSIIPTDDIEQFFQRFVDHLKEMDSSWTYSPHTDSQSSLSMQQYIICLISELTLDPSIVHVASNSATPPFACLNDLFAAVCQARARAVHSTDILVRFLLSDCCNLFDSSVKEEIHVTSDDIAAMLAASCPFCHAPPSAKRTCVHIWFGAIMRVLSFLWSLTIDERTFKSWSQVKDEVDRAHSSYVTHLSRLEHHLHAELSTLQSKGLYFSEVSSPRHGMDSSSQLTPFDVLLALEVSGRDMSMLLDSLKRLAMGPPNVNPRTPNESLLTLRASLCRYDASARTVQFGHSIALWNNLTELHWLLLSQRSTIFTFLNRVPPPLDASLESESVAASVPTCKLFMDALVPPASISNADVDELLSLGGGFHTQECLFALSELIDTPSSPLPLLSNNSNSRFASLDELFDYFPTYLQQHGRLMDAAAGVTGGADAKDRYARHSGRRSHEKSQQIIESPKRISYEKKEQEPKPPAVQRNSSLTIRNYPTSPSFKPSTPAQLPQLIQTERKPSFVLVASSGGPLSPSLSAISSPNVNNLPLLDMGDDPTSSASNALLALQQSQSPRSMDMRASMSLSLQVPISPAVSAIVPTAANPVAEPLLLDSSLYSPVDVSQITVDSALPAEDQEFLSELLHYFSRDGNDANRCHLFDNCVSRPVMSIEEFTSFLEEEHSFLARFPMNDPEAPQQQTALASLAQPRRVMELLHLFEQLFRRFESIPQLCQTTHDFSVAIASKRPISLSSPRSNNNAFFSASISPKSSTTLPPPHPPSPPRSAATSSSSAASATSSVPAAASTTTMLIDSSTKAIIDNFFQQEGMALFASRRASDSKIAPVINVRDEDYTALVLCCGGPFAVLPRLKTLLRRNALVASVSALISRIQQNKPQDATAIDLSQWSDFVSSPSVTQSLPPLFEQPLEVDRFKLGQCIHAAGGDMASLRQLLINFQAVGRTFASWDELFESIHILAREGFHISLDHRNAIFAFLGSENALDASQTVVFNSLTGAPCALLQTARVTSGDGVRSSPATIAANTLDRLLLLSHGSFDLMYKWLEYLDATGRKFHSINAAFWHALHNISIWKSFAAEEKSIVFEYLSNPKCGLWKHGRRARLSTCSSMSPMSNARGSLIKRGGPTIQLDEKSILMDGLLHECSVLISDLPASASLSQRCVHRFETLVAYGAKFSSVTQLLSIIVCLHDFSTDPQASADRHQVIEFLSMPTTRLLRLEHQDTLTKLNLSPEEIDLAMIFAGSGSALLHRLREMNRLQEGVSDFKELLNSIGSAPTPTATGYVR